MDNFSGTSEVLYIGLLLSIGLQVSYEEFVRLPTGTKQQIATRILALVNDPDFRLEHNVKEGALKMAEMFIPEGPTMNAEEPNALFNGGGDDYSMAGIFTTCEQCDRGDTLNGIACPNCGHVNLGNKVPGTSG
jgi:hypothetical protein